MRKRWLVSLIIVGALFILPVVGGEGYFTQEAKAASSDVDKNTITVNGEGEVSITPDIAHIQFGVISEGETADEAHQNNAAIFESIHATLTEQNIAEKDIQTVRFHAYPNYEYRENGRELIGYQVSHIISVKYRNLDNIGNFLDLLAQVGVNTVENIQYGTEKSTEYELAALEAALENARQKAEVLAKTQGKTLKNILHIYEGSGYNAPIYGGYNMEFAAKSAADTQNTVMYTGELSIKKQVQVTYQFE